MESKLDLILKKMEQLEKKNPELEMKFHRQSTVKLTSKALHSPPRDHIGAPPLTHLTGEYSTGIIRFIRR